jgi:ribonuclease J
MYSLLKPKNIIPVHGEYHMRADHAKMVHHDLGFQPTNIALIGNGDILEIEGGEIHKSREKASGEHIFVDGNMRGDVGPEIQKDRKALMNGGLVSFLFEVDRDTKKLKHPPRIQSLGFLYAHEKEVATKIKKEAMDLVHQVLQKHDDPVEKRQEIEHEVSKKLPGKITQLTDREPRVLVSVVIH